MVSLFEYSLQSIDEIGADDAIRAFGSFASGLYLPTADIDLVLLSNTFLRTGVRNTRA
jgi:DNA polymerase sigma